MHEPGERTRIVSREVAPGRYEAFVLHRDEEPVPTHEELVAKFNEWQRSKRHLRAVDDE